MRVITNSYIWNYVQKAIMASQIDPVKAILATVVSGVQEKQKYGVKKLNKAIYRGAQNVNLDNYKPNSIGFWPLNIRATKRKSLAKQKSKLSSPDGSIVYFKIYLTSSNSTMHAVELDPSACTTTQNDEVLILPSFSFQVVRVSTKAHCTKITLIQLPYQNSLKLTQIDTHSLIWCDSLITDF